MLVTNLYSNLFLMIQGAGQCCGAGYYLPENTTNCLVCPVGKYSEPGAVECTSCDAGKYAQSGAGSCSVCPSGKSSYVSILICSKALLYR